MNKLGQLDFIHLHCHSEFSALDGMPSVEEYLIRAATLDQKGLVLSEHGNLRSMVQLFIKSTGKFEYQDIKYDFPPIKPIIGIEFYVSPGDHRIRGIPDNIRIKIKRQSKDAAENNKLLAEYKHEHQIDKRYHLLAFAKNDVGLKNLMKLNYFAWRDGFYYRPRIDFDLLKKYSEGLIITTSCTGSLTSNMIINGMDALAAVWLKGMKKIFKDDLYIEIQPNRMEEQKIVNIGLMSLADELKIKVVATNDCHYVDKDDWKAHEVLLAIQSNRVLTDEKAWKFGDNTFYLRSKEQMFFAFKKHHPSLSLSSVYKALENTMEVYEKCNVSINVDKKQAILPRVFLPDEYENSKKYIIALCRKGWKWRRIKERSKKYAERMGISEDESYNIYTARLKTELGRIFKLKFQRYFLIIYELIKWARDQDIMVGPGRGSSSGSIVCYLLGITSVDPIEYDLLFDRFLNENRIDYPDIDMDFEDKRRKEIFKHLFDKYGKKHVCLVGTFGRMKGKQALQDVARTMEISRAETTEVTKHIIIRSSGDARVNQSVEDSFEDHEVCKEYGKRHPEVLPFVKKLEGKVRHVGIHACGIQLSPMVIEEYIPIEFRDTKNKEDAEIFGSDRLKVSAIDWRDSQDMGLIKIDVLGLRTLSILKAAADKVKERSGEDIDFESMDLEMPEVLKGFTKADFVGIFQFDSIGMANMCKKVTFDIFEDIVSLNALYRPGSLRSGVATDYLEIKRGKKKAPKLHKIYDEITKNTCGQVIYQEQLIQCFVKLADYHPGAADEIRKAVAKSFGHDFIHKQQSKFLKGCIKNGLNETAARTLFNNISFMGSYAFNKSHSAAYSMIAYWSMYMKIFHPIEFYYALMKYTNEHDKIISFINDARKHKVNVEFPDINLSNEKFSIDDDDIIRSGLIDVKGVGIKAASEIAAHQPYSSIPDFCDKVNRRVVNKGVIYALIKANAFENLYSDTGALLYEVDDKPVWEHMLEIDEEQSSVMYLENVGKNTLTEDSNMLMMSSVCPVPSSKHRTEYYEWLDKYWWEQPLELKKIEWRDRLILKGILLDIKYNNIGDFHWGEPPSEQEMKDQNWGKRYANVNLEDKTGKHRVSIDLWKFPTFRHIIDRGEGTTVIISARTFKKKEMIQANIMADLEDIRLVMDKNLTLKERYNKLNNYEKYFIRHPAVKHKKRSDDDFSNIADVRRTKIKDVSTAIGLITHTYPHRIRTGVMRFINIEDETGVMSVSVWPDTVEQYDKILSHGSICQVTVVKNRKGYNLQKIKGLEKIWSLTAI
jgi:DNA polymerase-3 subunit alpha